MTLQPIVCGFCTAQLVECPECSLYTGTCKMCGKHICCDCEPCHKEEDHGKREVLPTHLPS